MGGEENNFNFVVSAPGKVILFGEHSVVYKKAAVCTSINRRLSFFVKAATENVSVKFPQINTALAWSMEQFEKVVRGNCPLDTSGENFALDKPELIDFNKYVESLSSDLEHLGVSMIGLQEKPRAALLGLMFVFRGMFHNMPAKLKPFSIEVQSNIDVGAGIGSSAAFSVALSGAVLYLRKIFESSNSKDFSNSFTCVEDNVVIKSFQENSGFSMNEAKIINKWAFCVERLMHGRPSGIDNTTCTFGSVVVTSQKDRTGQLVFNFLENVCKISLLLISTGVSRNTANLVAKVRQLREGNCAAIDAILNAMDVIALEAFKTLEKLGTSSFQQQNSDLYKTLSHLIELNHGLLRTLGVSHEALEKIVSTTARHGLSTKLTGAGGGGFAITLLPPKFSREQVEELKNELQPMFKVSEISIAEEGVTVKDI